MKTATKKTVEAALSCNHNGHSYEWGIIKAENWDEWEKKAREILRDNGIPDDVRAKKWVNVK